MAARHRGVHQRGAAQTFAARVIRVRTRRQQHRSGTGIVDLAGVEAAEAEEGTGQAITVDEAAAIAHWQRASGWPLDSTALRWWRVYAQVMGLAIWISSGREVADGRSIDPVMIFSSLYTYRFHNRTLAATLRGLAA